MFYYNYHSHWMCYSQSTLTGSDLLLEHTDRKCYSHVLLYHSHWMCYSQSTLTGSALLLEHFNMKCFTIRTLTGNVILRVFSQSTNKTLWQEGLYHYNIITLVFYYNTLAGSVFFFVVLLTDLEDKTFVVLGVDELKSHVELLEDDDDCKAEEEYNVRN